MVKSIPPNLADDMAVDLGPLDDILAFHLTIASGLLLQTFVTMVGDRSRNARYVILSLIRLNPGITLAELSRTNFRDKSSMSPVVNGFIAQGFVSRQRVNRNGRPAQALRLTEAGEQLWTDLQPYAEEHTRRTAALLGETENRTLIVLLRKLVAGLVDMDRDLNASTE